MQFIADHKLASQDSPAMYAKSAIIIALWIASYGALLVGGAIHFSLALVGAAVMSFFTLCMEMAVMHDASHDGLSKHRKINRLFDLTLIVVGASPILWYHKHVKAHHFNTNIPDHDHDIDAGAFFRFHSASEWRPWHRFQHLYAVLLYACLGIKWIWYDDFYDAIKNIYGLNRTECVKTWLQIIVSRLSHFTIFLGLPYLVTQSVGAAIGVLLIHWMLVSVMMAVTFQLAHVTGIQAFPTEENKQASGWIRHQLETTADFAVQNRFLGWAVGGLNMQVEHHIFPRLPHIVYRRIQPVVRDYCAEHGIQYHEYSTIRGALADHFRYLRQLGEKPVAA